MNKAILITIFLFTFALNPESYSESSPPASQKRSANILEQAVTLYKKGNKQPAEQLLIDWIKKANYQQLSQRPIIYRSYLTLADMYRRRSAYQEEVLLFEQLLLHFKAWGLEHSVDVVSIKRQLGEALIQIGQEMQAITTLQEAIQLAQKHFPSHDLRLANLRLILAQSHINRLEVESAKQLLQQVEKTLQANQASPDNKNQSISILTGRLLQAQGELFFRQAKTKQASLKYAQALQHRQQLFGPKHLETAQSMIAYASSLKGLHRFSEAEALYRQGYQVYDSQLGADHVFIANILNNLGQLYYLQGRFAEAEEVLFRALDIKQYHFHDKHLSLAETYSHLSYVYFHHDDFKLAEQFLDKAIHIWSLPNAPRPRYQANAQVWKSIITYHSANNHPSVAETMQKAIKRLESFYGTHSVMTADGYYHLGQIYQEGKQSGDLLLAEQAYLNGLKSTGQFGQGERLTEIQLHAKLAKLSLQKDQPHKAWQETQKSINGLELRIKRFSGLRAHSLATELKSLREAVIDDISVLYQLLNHPRLKLLGLTKAQLIEDTFRASQLSRASSVARSLAQMEQRFASGDTELAKLIRNRQDLLEKWQEIDNILAATMSSSEAIKDRAAEHALMQEAIRLKQEIEKTDQQLQKNFPDYSSLTQPKPLSIKQVQGLLKPNESLLVYLFGKQHSFLWAITADQAEVFQLPISEPELFESVLLLREYLEPVNGQKDSQVPAFPVQDSYQLFRQILLPAMPTITHTKRLLIIADQALQSLPLSLLVVSQPQQSIRTPAEHIDVDWLIRHKTISVLPAVNSLEVLRAKHLSTSSSKTFLGIGDPALRKFLASDTSTIPIKPDEVSQAQNTLQHKALLNASFDNQNKTDNPPTADKDNPRGVSRGLSRGVSRGLSRGLSRGMNRGLNRGMNRGFNRGMNRGLGRGMNRGANRGMNRGLNRGLKRITQSNILTEITDNLGAYVELEDIALMIELPDTADELRSISKILATSENDLYLRDQATRSQVLDLNTEDFKIIQFATHGLMAGEFQGLFEPALVLTPEVQGNFYDNGLLTASDITQMKLNADFVVLSACNTAAPDGSPGAEGLSGLGRAFFYAGSKALMVTHWAVMSDVAVKMTTQIFDHMQNHQHSDIALAHQQSTLQLINNNEMPYYAHPMFWAPFTIVGDQSYQ